MSFIAREPEFALMIPLVVHCQCYQLMSVPEQASAYRYFVSRRIRPAGRIHPRASPHCTPATKRGVGPPSHDFTVLQSRWTITLRPNVLANAAPSMLASLAEHPKSAVTEAALAEDATAMIRCAYIRMPQRMTILCESKDSNMILPCYMRK